MEYLLLDALGFDLMVHHPLQPLTGFILEIQVLFFDFLHLLLYLHFFMACAMIGAQAGGAWRTLHGGEADLVAGGDQGGHQFFLSSVSDCSCRHHQGRLHGF